MNSPTPNQFLKPAIQTDGLPDLSLLSLRASFLTCFFGGPLVGFLLMRKNNRFFQRPKIELAVLILLTLASMGILFQLASSRNVRMLMQFCAVILWLVHYSLNRKEYQLYELQGSDYGNPWFDVGKSFLLGIPLTLLAYGPVIVLKVLSK